MDLHTLARHLVLALEPLKVAVADLPGFRTMLYRLGWDVKSLPPEYTALTANVDRALAALDGLGDNPTPVQIFTVLNEVKALYTALQGITNAPEGVNAAEFLPEIGRSLFELLLGDYLNEAFPSLHSALLALDILTQRYMEETDSRPGVLLTQFQWEEVPKLLTDPGSIPTRVYGWGTDDVDFHRLAGHLLEFFVAQNWPAYIGRVDSELGRGFKDAPDDPATSIDWGLTIPVLLDNIGGEEIEVGIALLELPAQGGKPAGLILQPLVPAVIGTSFDLTDELRLELRPGSDVASTFGVLLRPGDISVKFPFQEGAALPEAGFGVTLRYAPESPTLLLGTSGKSRLELKGAATSFNLDVREGQFELRLEAAPQDMTLVIAAADVDGFLGELLGGQDMTAPLPLTVRWSNMTGIGFVGGTGFQVSLPGNLRLGPITLQQLQFALRATRTPGHAPDLLLEAGVSLGGQLGPVSFSVDNIGLRLVSRFTDGNAGPFDIELGFKPPNGIGLVIDAQAVTGAGYLEFYPERGEYLGAAQLRIKDKIQVKAIGLILTKPEVSSLLLVSAEFPPVQLGLGFKLNGVGGLAGVHRGINEEQLFAGLRDNTLDDLLFPEDPLQNIHGLLGKLNDIFPPTEGQYTFGLMGLITWGPQDLVTIKLGLIVEFPTALRLVVVGTLKAAVTKTIQGREISILHLQVNFAGLIDFDEQFIRFDAALYQSKLLGLALEGEMALRLKYGANPDFVVTLGGFHPDFQPPALRLPAELRRLQITLLSGNPHIWIDAYLAVTANTFQFGASGHLRFSKWGVQVSGDLGFDALFQFSPFRFEAAVYFRLSASWKGREFASIEIDGIFSGPSPWRIRGQFKLKICWFLKISVPFDISWGDDDPTLLGLVDVLSLLVEDLRAPANWERTPGRTRLLVTARQSLHVDQNGAADLLLHPNDLLTVRQNTVPLGLPIDKFSEKRPQGASRFTVALQAADGTPDDKRLSGTPVKNHFAPGQFFHRSDEEKLQAKSYELFDAGATFEGLDGVTFEAWSGQEVAYESDYVDDLAVEPKPPPEQPEPLQAESQQDFDLAVRNNTLANSALARRARPRVASTADQITEQYVVANQATLAIHDNLITDSETEARLLLRDLIRRDPRQARELTVLLKAETP